MHKKNIELTFKMIFPFLTEGLGQKGKGIVVFLIALLNNREVMSYTIWHIIIGYIYAIFMEISSKSRN